MTDDVWREIEADLARIYSLPHNRVSVGAFGSTPGIEVQKTLEAIRSGFTAAPRKEVFVGPKLFLRVIGPPNRAYSGEWWFDAELLERVEQLFERTSFDDKKLREVIRNMLRDLLAVSMEWNSIEEVWALSLPLGERLAGYSGIASPQKLYSSLPLNAAGNRTLAGKARQIFFPVKNPLWVRHYRQLNL